MQYANAHQNSRTRKAAGTALNQSSESSLISIEAAEDANTGALFANLKPLASDARTNAANASNLFFKVGYTSQSIAYRMLFIIYRMYRGFFVLLPALFSNVLKALVLGDKINITTTYSKPNMLQKMLLSMHTGWGKAMRETVINKYFDGVNKKNAGQITSCFADDARIRDVCNLSGNSKLVRSVDPSDLSLRCMEFLTAHPDTVVEYYYKPTCGGGNSRWVFAHWFETGTWSGKSCGLDPEGSPLDVEGQTRFLVNDDLQITDLVVTRTFSDWEKKLYEVRNS